VLWIFIALKNPSPWLGLITQTLGQVASTHHYTTNGTFNACIVRSGHIPLLCIKLFGSQNNSRSCCSCQWGETMSLNCSL
jgi:hypothetical protein